jgi:hypothetical protein
MKHCRSRRSTLLWHRSALAQLKLPLNQLIMGARQERRLREHAIVALRSYAPDDEAGGG